jgi:hypothetical protein
MYRFPYLVSHAYLGDDADLAPHDAPDVIRTLLEGDTLTTRLARMDGAMVDAVERGLARASTTSAAAMRASILSDLVSLREARGRWADAASLLRARLSAGPTPAAARAGREGLPEGERCRFRRGDAALALVRMPCGLSPTGRSPSTYAVRDLRP